ncbi:TetR/AcrR family transcriptional regulator [Brachybacterium sp. AOP25-B2-12]|uniref:TetR/AcrR family transcriptional regulator n=1 Tax=Brachybacterium sp. AOP25-B2-12 TaxID=3457710 RepID=UPI0040340791
MPDPAPAPLRADAVRNRDRVAAAARAAFAEEGPEVPIIEIARRASVGTATLYRHFPTRESLLELVFEDRIAACSAMVAELLDRADLDPGGAFEAFLASLFEQQRADRAFSAALLRPFSPGERVDQERRRVLAGLDRIIDRAREAGAVRSDLSAADVEVLLHAHDGVLAHAAPRDGAPSTRFAQLAIAGCRAVPDAPPRTPHVL